MSSSLLSNVGQFEEFFFFYEFYFKKYFLVFLDSHGGLKSNSTFAALGGESGIKRGAWAVCGNWASF